jgi:hypothetical protein
MRSYTHICFLLLVFVALSCEEQEQNVVAWVNNEAITKAELKHWMLLEKANVYNYFYRKYKADDSQQFWTQKLGDEIPLEKLKSVAMKKAKQCKVQQILARKKGLIDIINFDEIIGQLELVNADRKKKVENGEPIYGPVEFTSRTYFFHVFDKMQIDLKNELAKEELKPDNSVLMKMKSEHKQTSNDASGFLTMQYVDANYDLYINKLMSIIEVKINKGSYDEVHLN